MIALHSSIHFLVVAFWIVFGILAMLVFLDLFLIALLIALALFWPHRP